MDASFGGSWRAWGPEVPLLLRCDRVLIWTILSLSMFGLMMVYSTTAASEQSSTLYITKQLCAAVIGFGGMYALMFFDYRHLRNEKVVFAVLAICIGLLVLAMALGTGANTRRFLRVGLMSLQPSELAKPAAILFLAWYLERKRDSMDRFSTLIVPGIVIGTLAGLILVGKDFGTTACLAILAGTMLFIAGTPLRFLGICILPAIPLLYVVVWQVQYRRDRIFAFLNPDADPLGSGFQILQSQIAVGSGGWVGQGWMAGKQKMYFLPEAHTDFIFAMVGEELGLLGSMLLVIAFGLFLWRGVRAALGAPDLLGVYLAGGITAMVVTQAMLNIGVVLGLLPTKGMPLPFISYGGSSLMTTLASSGVLLNVSRFGR